jgi:SAM-dependent methyltransferase
MHLSALKSFLDFQDTYLQPLKSKNLITIMEVGSYSVNSSIRKNISKDFKYIGVDIKEGPNVDVVLADPYRLPFDDNSIDAVVSISTFEHTEFFWLTYLEILRVLKPDGLFFLNVPSNGKYHRYSTDNWRFYPDSSLALAKWGNKNNYNPEVLEHYTNHETGIDIWNDYVSVTIKNKELKKKYLNRIIQNKINFSNGRIDESKEIINYVKTQQDQNNWGWKLHYKIRKKIYNIKNFFMSKKDS